MRLRTISRLLAWWGCVACFFSKPPPAHGFGAYVNTHRLMVDKPQWRIGYAFTPDCPEPFRQREEDLKALIVKTLQVWLEPLRERYPERQFTDDFLLIRRPDSECFPANHLGWFDGAGWDFNVFFDCKRGHRNSYGSPGVGVCIGGTKIDRTYQKIVEHEIGHVFGLADTYVSDKWVELGSTGGLARTIGKQPASVMSIPWLFDVFSISRDDKNGIIWLYKFYYEDHPVDDCFFPDYVLERSTHKTIYCEPEYPLIFEIKHGTWDSVRQILKDDPTLEFNGRDSQGNTALHHAVLRGDTGLVKTLLAKRGIKVNITNKTFGWTPAQLARKFHQKHLAKLIEAHPSARYPRWSVDPAQSVTTTWGALKRAR